MFSPFPSCLPFFMSLTHRWGDTPDVSSLLWGSGVQDLSGDMVGKP